MPGNLSILPREIGFVETQLYSNPGVGTSFFAVIPANEVWRINAVNCTLVTAVAVATRQLRFEFRPDTGGSINPVVIAGVTQIASLTYDYFFMRGFGFSSAAVSPFVGQSAALVSFPDFYCWGGSVFLIVQAIQAADQISGVEIQRQKWLLS